MGFVKLYLRKWVIRHSGAYSSVTVLLNGEQASHEMRQPSMLFKYCISANCINLQDTGRKYFIYCMFTEDLSLGFPDWHRQWRAAATEMTSSSVPSLNTARSWGFITANCILQYCIMLVSPTFHVHFHGI